MDKKLNKNTIIAISISIILLVSIIVVLNNNNVVDNTNNSTTETNDVIISEKDTTDEELESEVIDTYVEIEVIDTNSSIDNYFVVVFANTDSNNTDYMEDIGFTWRGSYFPSHPDTTSQTMIDAGLDVHSGYIYRCQPEIIDDLIAENNFIHNIVPYRDVGNTQFNDFVGGNNTIDIMCVIHDIDRQNEVISIIESNGYTHGDVINATGTSAYIKINDIIEDDVLTLMESSNEFSYVEEESAVTTGVVTIGSLINSIKNIL